MSLMTERLIKWMNEWARQWGPDSTPYEIVVTDRMYLHLADEIERRYRFAVITDADSKRIAAREKREPITVYHSGGHPLIIRSNQRSMAEYEEIESGE